jgi:hypothetical protein
MKSYDDDDDDDEDDDDQEKLSLWSNTVFFGNMHGKTRFLKKDNIVADGMMVYESIYILISSAGFQNMFQHVSTIDDYPIIPNGFRIPRSSANGVCLWP